MRIFSSVWDRFGIAHRVTFVVFVLMFCSISTIVYLTLNVVIQEHSNFVNSEQSKIIEIARYSLVQPIWNYDNQVVEDIVTSFISENDSSSLVAIKVVSADGEILAEKKSPSYANQNWQDLTRYNNLNLFQSNIRYDHRVIATLYFYFSDENFSRDIKNSIVNVLWFTSATVIILTLLMYLGLRWLLIRPLDQLVQKAKKIEDGDYSDQSFDARYVAELGQLANAFHSAIKAIVVRDQKLKDNMENLELLVQQRTQELDAQRAYAVNASRLASLGEMSAGIAHEINNPLCVIDVQLRLIKRNFPMLSYEELMQKFDKILQMTDRISKIINNLRSFSRDGSLDDQEEIDIDQIMSDVLELCNPKLKSIGVELTVDCRRPGLKLYCQQIPISQVLVNMISNAADAVEALPEQWVKVLIHEDLQNVFIDIIDSGEGIPDDILEKLMQPFFTTKDIGKGTGLGLSISQSIIKQHGGDLVYLKDQQNTTFRITLPKNEVSHIQVA